MKRTLTAAIAAFLLVFSFVLTAHAEPLDGSDTPTGTEYPPNTEVVNPFTPSGTGTVVDLATGEDGKVFYTIVATDESVYYLVIDYQRGTENVYFLNAVTVDDLIPLAAQPGTQTAQGGTVSTTTPPATTETPVTDTPPSTEQGGGNATIYIIIAVLAVLGGGAGYYFKIYRPKQQSAGALEEYEPPADEDETDFDDWGDEDAPPWDEDESGVDGE